MKHFFLFWESKTICECVLRLGTVSSKCYAKYYFNKLNKIENWTKWNRKQNQNKRKLRGGEGIKMLKKKFKKKNNREHYGITSYFFLLFLSPIYWLQKCGKRGFFWFYFSNINQIKENNNNNITSKERRELRLQQQQQQEEWLQH